MTPLWSPLVLLVVLFSGAVLSEDAISEETRQKRGVVVNGPGAVAAVGPVVAAGAPHACPGGGSLGVPCDAKRPWPQCPPQSYCFAVNSVDIGPYYCCPVWSTYGALWRPRTWYYPYFPPNPYPYPWPAGVAPAVGALDVAAAGAVFPLAEKNKATKRKKDQAEETVELAEN